MTEQKLTISGLYRSGWPRWPEAGQVPHLPLTGAWLVEAGFPVGTRVVVEAVEDGELVVRRVEEAEAAGAGRPTARERRDREAWERHDREAAHA